MTDHPPADARRPQPIDPLSLLRLLPDASPLCLILDYDGTLVPFASRPDRASPDPALIGLLGGLSARHDRQVHIVSGRVQCQLDQWFGALPVGLYAEHGVWCRARRDSPWRRLAEPVEGWPHDIVETLEQASGMLPGSLLELKSASLAFHFRAVRRDCVGNTLPWLRGRLTTLAAQHAFALVEGAELLELRALGVSKATAAARIQSQTGPGARLIAFGDDTTDEDMFRALPGALTIHVGPGPSLAGYSMLDHVQVRTFLAALL